ncbi:MAG: Transposase-like protein [Thermoplasmatales archaeon Gpl]|nr:MAG: Transposase-like protein [Thermoplasmatales archaeon Gpl]
MAAGIVKHGSSDKSEVREWKRKQGFEMLKKGVKKSVISKKLGVNRRTVYNWSIKLEQSEDWHDRKQLSRGRPSTSTEYGTITKKLFHVEWKPMADNIDFDEACDGIFPLITNDRNLSMKEILAMYRYQPYVEKRHEQLKSVYAVAPVMLKNVDRIEGLLFVYFLALLIESLIEREVRNSMKKEGRESIRIYPEYRSCESPTTDRVLGDFTMVQMNWIESGGKMVKKFLPKLTQRQEDLLKLEAFQSVNIRRTGMRFRAIENSRILFQIFAESKLKA